MPLALVLAGAWLSNLPLGVMAGYLLAGIALIAALVNRTWFPVLRAALATALGLGLAAIYWLPAALERNWVDIKQATQDPGYNFENNWLFARNANPVLALHDSILRQVSWIAVSMIAVTVICLAIAWRRGTLSAKNQGNIQRLATLVDSTGRASLDHFVYAVSHFAASLASAPGDALPAISLALA